MTLNLYFHIISCTYWLMEKNIREVMSSSASEKGCSNSCTGTVWGQTKYALYNQSVISVKILLYIVCKNSIEAN